MHYRLNKPTMLAAAVLCMALPASAQIAALPAHQSTSALSGAEYFFDTDPGYGSGQALAVTPGNDISGTPVISIHTLDRGAHRLFVRSRNSAGAWSMTHSQIFVIYTLLQALPQSLSGTQVAAAEYFIDSDPGLGNGTPVPLPPPGADLTASNVAVDINGLSLGIHRVFFRSRNASGIWSLGHGSTFTILINTIGGLPSHSAARPITAIEYFIDTDPGFGNGTILNAPATTDLAAQTLAVDVSALANGPHTLFVRSINGHSMAAAHAFAIGSTALPINWLNLGLRSEGSAALIDWNIEQTGGTVSYAVERSADAKSFSGIGSVAAQAGSGKTSYQFRDEAPLPGQSYYRIRLDAPGEQPRYSKVLQLRRDETAAEVRFNNPVTSTLTVKRLGEGARDIELSIRDASGKEVAHPGRGGAVQTFDLSMLPPGAYLLCWQQNGRPVAQRFIKQ